ncbi:MAG: 50S ribosomal protein L21e [Candidatus Pacearchaeota archaeon]
MIRKKELKDNGKIKLSRYFQKFKEGDKITILRELALQPKFPSKLQGRCGTITGARGKSYLIKINDLSREKTYIIHPAHLKKIR